MSRLTRRHLQNEQSRQQWKKAISRAGSMENLASTLFRSGDRQHHLVRAQERAMTEIAVTPLAKLCHGEMAAYHEAMSEPEGAVAASESDDPLPGATLL